MFFRCILHIVLIEAVFSAKILIYNPLYGQSHVNFFSTLGEILTEEGHQVVSFLSESFELKFSLSPVANENVRVDERKFSSMIKIDLPSEVKKATGDSLDDPIVWTGDFNSPYVAIQLAKTLDAVVMHGICASLINSSVDFFERLKRERFDVGIAEFFDGCGIGIFHQIGLENTVIASSFALAEHLAQAVGAPSPSSYLPATISNYIPEDLQYSLLKRIWNLVLTEASRISLQLLIDDGSQKAFSERFPDFPLLSRLTSKSSLVVINSDPLFNFPRPTLNKIVNIGGIAVPKANNLSADWLEVMSRRKRNVLISFGSIAKSYMMPTESKKAVVEVVKRFPDTTFVWKYEKPDDEIGRGVENLVKTAWMPQSDLLQSGLLSLFISHGGMGSVMEVAHSGVPALFVPLFAEQMANAASLKAQGAARVLLKYELHDAAKLENEIRRCLENDSYAKEAKRLAALLKKRPFSPREIFVRNIKFVAENGPFTNFSPISTRMSSWQLYFIDAVLLTVLVLATFIFGLYRLKNMAKERFSLHLKKE